MTFMAPHQHGFRCLVGGVLVRDLGDEVVLHVQSTDTWHALDAVSTAVYRAADGAIDTAELASRTGLPVDQVDVALAALVGNGLVQVPLGMDRRSLLQRGALVGGAALAGGTILSVMSPTMAAAASPPVAAGIRVSLRSTTDASSYLTASNTTSLALSEGASLMTMATIASNSLDILKRQATFFVRAPVFGATGFSFESVGPTNVASGNYIRHGNWFIRVQPKQDNNADFVFVQAAGKNGKGSSFRAVQDQFSAQYIRRYTAGNATQNRVVLTSGADGTNVTPGMPYNTSTGWNDDVSFYIADPLAP